MSGLKELREATQKARTIVDSFIGGVQSPDVIEARKTELTGMKKEELIDLVVKLEKPKADRTSKVEPVVQALLTEPACAALTYDQVAALVREVLPESKTSSKSVASYASKKGEAWGVVKRQRVRLDNEEILRLTEQAVPDTAVNE